MKLRTRIIAALIALGLFVGGSAAKSIQRFGFSSPVAQPYIVMTTTSTQSATTTQFFGNVGPQEVNLYDLGNPLAWRNIYASGTAYLGTGAVIGGQNACLEDGTNCPAGIGTPSWEETLREGNIATSSFLTFGNGEVSNMTVTGTLTVSSTATVAGQNVCLEDGTNCPAGVTTPSWEETLRVSGTATSSFLTYGNGEVSNMTVTGTLVVSSTSQFAAITFTQATGTGTLQIGNINATNIIASALDVNGWASSTNIALDAGGNITVGGANAKATLVLSGRSGEALSGYSTSTQIAFGTVFSRTLPAMSATDTNCVYWGPEFIRDAWDGGTMTPMLQWIHASGTGNVIWALRAETVASGTYYGAEFSGAKSYATGTAIQGFYGTDLVMNALTIGGAAAGSAIKFELCREGDHGQDTFGNVAYPDSIKLEYGLGSYGD